MLVFFQAEDGIRDLVRSRGLGDVYKRQGTTLQLLAEGCARVHGQVHRLVGLPSRRLCLVMGCLLYTSDAADDLLCVDLGGRRIINKKKHFTLEFTINHLPPPFYCQAFFPLNMPHCPFTPR